MTLVRWYRKALSICQVREAGHLQGEHWVVARHPESVVGERRTLYAGPSAEEAETRFARAVLREQANEED